MNRAAEARRRRTLKLILTVIAAGALLPLLIYQGAVAALLAQCEAFVRECLQALLQVSPAQWLPIGLLIAGVFYAGFDFVRQIRRIRRVLRLHQVRSPEPGEPIHALAQAHGALGRVRVIEGPAPNPAFAAGLFHPRAYIAADLQVDLSPEELRALFRHELWHVRHRDPLRFAALRGLSRFFFWLPVVGSLAQEMIDDAELEADDFAAESADPLEVAGALVAVAQRSRAALALAAGATGLRPMERRVRRLLGEDEDGSLPTPLVPVRRLAGSLAILLIVWMGIAFGTPGAASATPSAPAAAEATEHCVTCPDQAVRAGHAGCHFLHLLSARS